MTKPLPLALSTTIRISGKTLVWNPTCGHDQSVIDERPILRCDLPLPTQDEISDDGGAAALIARSRKLER